MKDISSVEYIRLINIQTIDDYTFTFPRVGLVRFIGDNNNGKSIAVKSLNEVIKCNLHQPKNRAALINDNKQWGECHYKNWNGNLLIVHIDRESSETYYEMRYPDNKEIRRYLKDKDLSSFIIDFGWHYNVNRDFSLNIYNTYDPLFFVTTQGVLNKEVLDTSTTDPEVDIAIANIKLVNIDLKQLYEKLVNECNRLRSVIVSRKVYNIDEEKKKAMGLNKIADIVELIGASEIPVLPKIPNIANILDLDAYLLKLSIDKTVFPSEKLSRIYECLKIVDDLPVISDSIEKMKEVNKVREYMEKTICPVCKRAYSETHTLSSSSIHSYFESTNVKL